MNGTPVLPPEGTQSGRCADVWRASSNAFRVTGTRYTAVNRGGEKGQILLAAVLRKASGLEEGGISFEWREVTHKVDENQLIVLFVSFKVHNSEISLITSIQQMKTLRQRMSKVPNYFSAEL